MGQMQLSLPELGPSLPDDPEFATVVAYLLKHADVSRVGQALRGAIDAVLDGVHTGRYNIEQLDQTEKTYIGTKVEHFLLHELGLEKTPPLDTSVKGIAVDIKFSLHDNWMIPPEAFNRLCILASASDSAASFSFGVIRAEERWLNRPNRDQKRGLSADGRDHAHWLMRNAPLPENLLLRLSPAIREKIFAQPRGQQQVTELFRQVNGRLINLTAVDTVGRQRDSSKRVRQARKDLKVEDIHVLSLRYNRKRLEQLGFRAQIEHARDGWVAVRPHQSGEAVFAGGVGIHPPAGEVDTHP